jgi:hypothetical protein
MVANTSTTPAVLLGFYRLGIRVRQLQMLSEGSEGNIDTDLPPAVQQLLHAFFFLAGDALLPDAVRRAGMKRVQELRHLSISSRVEVMRSHLSSFQDWVSTLLGLVPSHPEAVSWWHLGLTIAHGAYQPRLGALVWQWEDPGLLDQLLGEVRLELADLFPPYETPVLTVVQDAAGYPPRLAGWCRLELRLEELFRQRPTELSDSVASMSSTISEMRRSLEGEGCPSPEERVQSEAVTITQEDSPAFEPIYGLDFRSVLWEPDQLFLFSPLQAACVKVLWEHAASRTPEVGQQTVLENAGSVSSRLVDLFKNHPALGTMIVRGQTKGSFRLSKPVQLKPVTD